MKAHGRVVVLSSLCAAALLVSALAARAELPETPAPPDSVASTAPDTAVQVPKPRPTPRRAGKLRHGKSIAQQKPEPTFFGLRLTSAPAFSTWNPQSCTGAHCGPYYVTMIGVGF